MQDSLKFDTPFKNIDIIKKIDSLREPIFKSRNRKKMQSLLQS
jgi:hypothetical protein